MIVIEGYRTEKQGDGRFRVFIELTADENDHLSGTGEALDLYYLGKAVAIQEHLRGGQDE